MMASTAISDDLNLELSKSLFLIEFGAVFLQRKGDAKARRLRRDEYVDVDDYLRVYPQPKYYNVDDINWRSRVQYETSDYVIIDKPPMVPSNPTTDNAYQNVVECFKRSLNLPVLYLPHRLDLETSGLMVLGKTKGFTADVSRQFKERRVQKRYQALIASSRDSAVPYEPSQLLVHYMQPSTTSPRVFTNSPPGVECRSTIVSASKVVKKSTDAWREWCSAHLVSEEHRRLRVAMESWLAIPAYERNIAFSSVELDLHSGRTHQCRGQLSSGDWHIAGDNLYPGCTSSSTKDDDNRVSDHLALQSSHLSFDHRGSRVTFELKDTWWEKICAAK